MHRLFVSPFSFLKHVCSIFIVVYKCISDLYRSQIVIYRAWFDALIPTNLPSCASGGSQCGDRGGVWNGRAIAAH